MLLGIAAISAGCTLPDRAVRRDLTFSCSGLSTDLHNLHRCLTHFNASSEEAMGSHSPSPALVCVEKHGAAWHSR